MHRYTLLPPIGKRTETTDIVATRDEGVLTNARMLCGEIAAKCQEHGIGGLCKVFGLACRDAVQPEIIGQFPETGGRKSQALWLYQIACKNGNFEEKECREKFSKAIWGFK